MKKYYHAISFIQISPIYQFIQLKRQFGAIWMNIDKLQQAPSTIVKLVLFTEKFLRNL